MVGRWEEARDSCNKLARNRALSTQFEEYTLIDPSIEADIDASQTGLYDLIGEFILLHVVINIVLTTYQYVAIVTHKGKGTRFRILRCVRRAPRTDR